MKFSLFDPEFVPRKIVRIRALSYILPPTRSASATIVFRFQMFGNEYWIFLRRLAKEDSRKRSSGEVRRIVYPVRPESRRDLHEGIQA